MTDPTPPKPHIALAWTMRAAGEANKDLSAALEALKGVMREATSTAEATTAIETHLVPVFERFRERFDKDVVLTDDMIAKGEWESDRGVERLRGKFRDIIATREPIVALVAKARTEPLPLPQVWASLFEILQTAFPDDD